MLCSSADSRFLGRYSIALSAFFKMRPLKRLWCSGSITSLSLVSVRRCVVEGRFAPKFMIWFKSSLSEMATIALSGVSLSVPTARVLSPYAR